MLCFVLGCCVRLPSRQLLIERPPLEGKPTEKKRTSSPLPQRVHSQLGAQGGQPRSPKRRGELASSGSTRFAKQGHGKSGRRKVCSLCDKKKDSSLVPAAQCSQVPHVPMHAAPRCSSDIPKGNPGQSSQEPHCKRLAGTKRCQFSKGTGHTWLHATEVTCDMQHTLYFKRLEKA